MGFYLVVPLCAFLCGIFFSRFFIPERFFTGLFFFVKFTCSTFLAGLFFVDVSCGIFFLSLPFLGEIFLQIFLPFFCHLVLPPVIKFDVYFGAIIPVFFFFFFSDSLGFIRFLCLRGSLNSNQFSELFFNCYSPSLATCSDTAYGELIAPEERVHYSQLSVHDEFHCTY